MKTAVKTFYEKHKAACILWGLFLLSTIVRAVMAGFPKHILVLYDELYYYQYAENLAKGRGFPLIYQFEYNFQTRFLYSILISPAFFTSNRILQFKLIAFINSLLLNISVFPTYLLAKRVLGNNKWSLLCAVLCAISSDMVYSISFMADIPMMSIGLWLIYFIYVIIDSFGESKKQFLIYLSIFCLFAVLSILCKRSGIIFFLILPVSIGIIVISRGFEARLQLKNYMFLFGLLVLVIVFLCLMLKATNLQGNIYFQVRSVYLDLKNNAYGFLKYYLYSLVQILFAGMVVPIVLPYIYYRKYDKGGKRLLLIITLIVLAFTLSMNRISMREENIGRIHLRYLMFIWMPYFILLCKLILDKCIKNGIFEYILWAIVLVCTAGFMFFYQGPHKATLIDYTLLYWMEHWDNFHVLYAALTFVILIVSFCMMRSEKRLPYMASLLFFIFCVQMYNNQAAYRNYRAEYEMDQTGIQTTEAFVRDHPSNNFLIINTGQRVTTDNAKKFDYLSGKISDTYLNYPNVYRTSLDWLIEKEKESEDGRCDFRNESIYIDLFFLNQEVKNKRIDYILLPVDSGVGSLLEDCKEIELDGQEWYRLYQLSVPSVVPHINSIRLLQEGTQSFPVDCGAFLSRYFVDEKSSFVSSGAKQDYLVYGPYITLYPGNYTFKVEYSYRGNIENGEIGCLDINGEGVDPTKYVCSLSENETSAVIKMSASEIIENFEIRVYAKTDGLQVETIEIDYKPMD